jgi:hypothetical protein
LSDLEYCGTDPKTVADAYLIIGQSFDGEVLAELSVGEVGPAQLLLPVLIRIVLVHEDGSLLTPVSSKITLTVSVQIQSADATGTTHRIFPYTGVHGSAFPFDVARKSDIHR